MKPPLRMALAVTSAITLLSGCSTLNASPPVPDDWTPRGSVSALVAFAPGGGSDRSARVIAQSLNELEAGFDVNVENKEGGSGAVGWATFMAEKGNGNALLVAESALNTLPIVYDVPFTYRDFTPLVMFARDSRMVVAGKDSPYDSCKELVEAGRKKPVKTGSSGKTGADSLVVAEFKKNGGRFSVVPYGSTGEVLTGLLGGRIDVAPASAAAAKPYLESGDFKALCTLTAKRYDDPVLKKVPTAREQGLDAEVTIWRGVLAPGGVDEVQRRYWIDAIHRAMRSGTYRDYIASDLLIPADVAGDDFEKYLDTYDRQMKEALS
ncbi:C4-dicarboxylate ABC transporter substrate-binding protein [Streptomyces viridiviolaceus]|uniref:Tripartite tricarboxylate transporter substrate binding protein n=1 Tax=Streptomyces viridiviolaceus TaxID=68282 RepID=A0ABW2ED39_9ACTN|nr:tripartite tricarboxylate transporter substrate binding protein [Streptomyces viridiviolaceus]GHB48508.1 C4-dicarboxylate ABC transporter substrate-binding protein [Streptomyces viridiviolaceus]